MKTVSQYVPADVVAMLAAIVGSAHLRIGAAVRDLDPGEHPDNLAAGIVVSPADTREAADVVQLCSRHGVSIVPQGGRTGLVGGAVSAPGQLVLSMRRLNAIERIDADERVAVVGAGCTLQTLQDEALKAGLEPGIDLAARGSATIGGMVSTNAGGIMAFRNGVMRHRVLGIEAVLADGSIYSDLTRVVKNATGYDLKHLFIGAEGTLGIVTRVALKLDPVPRFTATALFALPSTAAALAACRTALMGGSGQVRALEAMWASYFRYMAVKTGWTVPGDFAPDSEVYLIVSLGGSDEAELVEQLAAIAEELRSQATQSGSVIAGSLAQASAIWRMREDSSAIYETYPGCVSFDVSVPLSEIDAYLARMRTALARIDPGLAPFVFGHLGDGNLHIMLNRREGGLAAQTLAKVEAAVYRDLRSRGGAFSAEHGIGTARVQALRATANPVKLRTMQLVKEALDPAGIMNPGKVVPDA